MLQLAALLFLTGGLENPFAFLLIAPVTVSASTLPLNITAALGALAIVAATLLTQISSTRCPGSITPTCCCRSPM